MTGWTRVNDLFGSSARGLQVSGNKAQNSAVGASADVYTASIFAADQEAWTPLLAIGGGVDSSGVLLRITDPTGTPQGYSTLAFKGSGIIQVYRINGDSNHTQLGANISQTISNGDSIGASIIGSMITVYYKVGAGAWIPLDTRTDATYSSAGYLGLWADGGSIGSAQFSSFGGGAVNNVIEVGLHVPPPMFLGM